MNILPVSDSGSAKDSRTGDADHLNNARKRLIVATIVTMALWFLPYSDVLLYPLRLFVTFIHESGHALSALAVGGDVDWMRVEPNGSGVTMTRTASWWLWLVYSSGYLGTTVFGALMLIIGRVGRSPQAGRITLCVTSGYIFVVTLLWAHNPFTNGFTFLAGMVLAALLFAAARYCSLKAATFLAGFLAVQCCLNALGDLRILLYLTTNHQGDNDAVFISKAYGLPPTMWAALWAVTSVVILALALRVYWRAPRKDAITTAP